MSTTLKPTVIAKASLVLEAIVTVLPVPADPVPVLVTLLTGSAALLELEVLRVSVLVPPLTVTAIVRDSEVYMSWVAAPVREGTAATLTAKVVGKVAPELSVMVIVTVTVLAVENVGTLIVLVPSLPD